jgi:hypothetical protein
VAGEPVKESEIDSRPGADVSRSLVIGSRADVKEIFNIKSLSKGLLDAAGQKPTNQRG